MKAANECMQCYLNSIYPHKECIHLIAERKRRLNAPDPTMRLGPSESCWKPLATIPTMARRISGAERGPSDIRTSGISHLTLTTLLLLVVKSRQRVLFFIPVLIVLFLVLYSQGWPRSRSTPAPPPSPPAPQQSPPSPSGQTATSTLLQIIHILSHNFLRSPKYKSDILNYS